MMTYRLLGYTPSDLHACFVNTLTPYSKERACVDVGYCDVTEQLRLATFALHKLHPDTLVYLSFCNARDHSPQPLNVHA